MNVSFPMQAAKSNQFLLLLKLFFQTNPCKFSSHHTSTCAFRFAYFPLFLSSLEHHFHTFNNAAETSFTSLPKMPERSDLSALKGRSLYHGQIIRTIRRKQDSDPDSRCIAYSEPLLSHGWIEAPLIVVEAGKNKTLRLSNQQTHRSFLLLEKYSFLAFLFHVRMTKLLGGFSLQSTRTERYFFQERKMRRLERKEAKE